MQSLSATATTKLLLSSLEALALARYPPLSETLSRRRRSAVPLWLQYQRRHAGKGDLCGGVGVPNQVPGQLLSESPAQQLLNN